MTDSKQTHKVTVVTVCYNAEREIEDTIRSVVGQTYENIEYIIVDGGSTDRTLEIISRYSDRVSHLVSEPDKGIFDAMNKATCMASGDYIVFMNAGDTFFDENVLKEVFEGRCYDEDVLYGSTIQRYPGGYKAHHSGKAEDLDRTMPFCHQSSFTRTGVLRRYGFDTAYVSMADCIFFRRLWNDGGTFRYVDKYISVFDMSGYSVNKSWRYYVEACMVTGDIPSRMGYVKRLISIFFKPMRYGSLRFKIAERKHPGKYALSKDSFKQIPDKSAQ